jgi:murein DD-endopeptidase MepM/ murein hydrolase activator NlpD
MKTSGKSESQQLESFIVKQLLVSSGAFKGTEASGSSLTADMFADTLSDAISKGGGIGLSELLAKSLPKEPQSEGLSHVTSGFGNRIDPITGEESRHTGVDLAAPEGTPIPAAKDGVVIAAGPRGGYGNAIEVAHPDGTSTLYAHAMGVAVTPGVRVSEGETLGWVGQTGRSTGPHLHLELRRQGQFLDPGVALKAYRLRDEETGGGSP